MGSAVSPQVCLRFASSDPPFCSSLAKNGGKIGSAVLPFPESREASSTQPRYSVVRSFEFDKDAWPGYDHRRTIGHKEGKTSLLDREHAGARTWELALAPVVEKDGY